MLPSWQRSASWCSKTAAQLAVGLLTSNCGGACVEHCYPAGLMDVTGDLRVCCYYLWLPSESVCCLVVSRGAPNFLFAAAILVLHCLVYCCIDRSIDQSKVIAC